MPKKRGNHLSVSSGSDCSKKSKKALKPSSQASKPSRKRKATKYISSAEIKKTKTTKRSHKPTIKTVQQSCTLCNHKTLYSQNLKRHYSILHGINLRRSSPPQLKAPSREALSINRHLNNNKKDPMEDIVTRIRRYFNRFYSELTTVSYIRTIRSFLKYSQNSDPGGFSYSSISETSDGITFIPLSLFDSFIEGRMPATVIQICQSFKAFLKYMDSLAEKSNNKFKTHLAKEYAEYREKAEMKADTILKDAKKQMLEHGNKFSSTSRKAEERNRVFTRSLGILNILTAFQESSFLRMKTDKLLEDPDKMSRVIFRDHTMVLLYLETLGQRDSVLRNMLQSEYDDRTVFSDGVIISIQKHELSGSLGPAKVYVSEEATLRMLDAYNTMAKDWPSSPGGHFFRTIDGGPLGNSKSVMAHLHLLIKSSGVTNKDISSLTTEVISNAFATVCQSVDRLKGKISWLCLPESPVTPLNPLCNEDTRRANKEIKAVLKDLLSNSVPPCSSVLSPAPLDNCIENIPPPIREEVEQVPEQSNLEIKLDKEMVLTVQHWESTIIKEEISITDD